MRSVTGRAKMFAAPVCASFRDPSGHVYQLDGQVFRTVSDHFAPHFEFVESTGLLKTLARDGLVLPFEKIVKDVPALFWAQGVRYVLTVPRLPFVSFPYEWPFSALKAAALLHLNIHLAAIERGVTLSDASAYNVQFQGPQPVFIDHLSFRRYDEGELWAGHRQFCEQFLLPLLLRALFGVSHNAWYRGTLEGIPVRDFSRLLRWRHYLSWNVFTHVVLHSWFQDTTSSSSVGLEKIHLGGAGLPLKTFRRILHDLHAWISRLEPADTGKTVWQDYSNTNTYSAEEARIKTSFISDFVRRTRPTQLWDLGCNAGDYAKVALQAGASYVVGFDFDQGALEACYARAREERLAIQTLFMDVANPSPNQGWKEAERQGLHARGSADGILALAVIHHLAITRNIPLGQVLDWLIGLTPRGIIEFVPKSDPMVQRLLCLREDIFPDYTLEFVMQRMKQKTDIVHTAPLSPNGRLLIWYERR